MLDQFRPHYAKDFRCIGPECEDTCCQGWDVVIDQEAYKEFQSHPALKHKVKDHLVVIANATAEEYARVQLTPSCTCPFLSAERLCSIQSEFGERYLPGICADYPRATQTIDGLKETSLMLACPEAVRLVILNPNLMQPEDPVVPRYRRFARMGEQAVKANGSPYQFFWDIRAFTLLLLRDRSYPLWQRLFLLGMFCKRLHELTQTGNIELVPQLLREHSEIIVSRRLRPAMDGLPVRTALRLSALLEIISRHLETPAGKHIRFGECIKDFMAGIHFEDSCTVESCAPWTEEANVRYCAPFLEKHPYMLENYLTNYVFRARFPYGLDSHGQARDPLSEFMMMCILYALIKELLIGIAGHYRESFGSAHVVKVVQSVAKSVEQCPKFPLADYLSLANADGMALLLKSNS